MGRQPITSVASFSSSPRSNQKKKTFLLFLIVEKAHIEMFCSLLVILFVSFFFIIFQLLSLGTFTLSELLDPALIRT